MSEAHEGSEDVYPAERYRIDIFRNGGVNPGWALRITDMKTGRVATATDTDHPSMLQAKAALLKQLQADRV